VIEPRFLLDSNICIYVLSDADGPPARRLGQCAAGSVVTSSIVFAEVLRGAPRHGGTSAVEAFFDVVPILPFDGAAARAYARLPFRRGTFDRLIGAHALSRGLIFVTSNVRDYGDIPDLQIENWAEA
jgi:tRNA(fMet)-specific endonuclease VapC